MTDGMNMFLSEGTIKEHREYLCELKHKAAILEKSGLCIKNIAQSKGGGVHITRNEREKIKRLFFDIKMHELYFQSFSSMFMPCPKIKEGFGSENNFAFLITQLAEETECGFICIYSNRQGAVNFCNAENLPYGAIPHMAIDLCEHAYFRDYGFKKDTYVRAALSHLDFSKINSRRSSVKDENKRL